jgi:hypothetical protein
MVFLEGRLSRGDMAENLAGLCSLGKSAGRLVVLHFGMMGTARCGVLVRVKPRDSRYIIALLAVHCAIERYAAIADRSGVRRPRTDPSFSWLSDDAKGIERLAQGECRLQFSI